MTNACIVINIIREVLLLWGTIIRGVLLLGSTIIRGVLLLGGTIIRGVLLLGMISTVLYIHSYHL